MTILITNQRTGGIKSRKPSHATFGKGRIHPPQKSVTAIADTVSMLAYSARKNRENLKPLYSVWKPATSSDSASGRSNGARLVSPTAEMKYSTKLGNSSTTCQLVDRSEE